MNKTFLHSIEIILIGVIIGGVISYFMRPVIIGYVLGVAVGIKAGGITNWKIGAIYGAIIGLIIGASIGPFTVIIGTPSLRSYIALGLAGVVYGSIIGGITCKIFKSEKSWIW